MSTTDRELLTEKDKEAILKEFDDDNYPHNLLLYGDIVKDDADIAITAILKEPHNFVYISERLKEDQDFLKRLLSVYDDNPGEDRKFMERLKTYSAGINIIDSNFILQRTRIKKHYGRSSLIFAHPSLFNNKAFVLNAIGFFMGKDIIPDRFGRVREDMDNVHQLFTLASTEMRNSLDVLKSVYEASVPLYFDLVHSDRFKKDARLQFERQIPSFGLNDLFYEKQFYKGAIKKLNGFASSRKKVPEILLINMRHSLSFFSRQMLDGIRLPNRLEGNKYKNEAVEALIAERRLLLLNQNIPVPHKKQSRKVVGRI